MKKGYYFGSCFHKITALHEFHFSIAKALTDYEIVYHKLGECASLHQGNQFSVASDKFNGIIYVLVVK